MLTDHHGNQRNYDGGYPGQYGDNYGANVNMYDTPEQALNKLNFHSSQKNAEETHRITMQMLSAPMGSTGSFHPRSEKTPRAPIRSWFLVRCFMFAAKWIFYISLVGGVVAALAYGSLFYLAKSVPKANQRGLFDSVETMIQGVGSNREFPGEDISPPANYLTEKEAAQSMPPKQMLVYLQAHGTGKKYSPLFNQSAYSCIYSEACTSEFMGVAGKYNLSLLAGAYNFVSDKAIRGDERAAKDVCILGLKRMLSPYSIYYAQDNCMRVAQSPTHSAVAQVHAQKLNDSPWFVAALKISRFVKSHRSYVD